MQKIVPIHTSDVGLYKTCRRRWLWGSHLNRALEPVNKAAPLWFGEAVHYALKDFHGYDIDIIQSFLNYARLCKEKYPDRLPSEFNELLELGKGMLDHYMHWLARRPSYTTYVHNGVPQVEVAFEIELPIDPILLEAIGVDRVVYRGTMDRVIIDLDTDVLGIVDYKTAARMEQGHLLMDPQISKYMWAASCIYDKPVSKFVYQQHAKRIPKPARINLNGAVSTAKNQATTHRLYRQALVEVYGSPQQATSEHVIMLNMLAGKETKDTDGFIVRTHATRNAFQIAREGERVLLEVSEMLDPRTPMYIHAGQHCGWCPFISACTSLEDGGDWQAELEDDTVFVTRNKASSEWEIIAHDGLGGVLHSKKAKLYDGTGKSNYDGNFSRDTAYTSDGTEADKFTGVDAAARADGVYQPGRISAINSDPAEAFLSEYLGTSGT